MYHIISIIDQFHTNYVVHGDIALRNFIIDLSDYDNNIDLFIDKVIINDKYEGWTLPLIKAIDLGLTSFIAVSEFASDKINKRQLFRERNPGVDISDLNETLSSFPRLSPKHIKSLDKNTIELLDFIMEYRQFFSEMASLSQFNDRYSLEYIAELRETYPILIIV